MRRVLDVTRGCSKARLLVGGRDFFSHGNEIYGSKMCVSLVVPGEIWHRCFPLEE